MIAQDRDHVNGFIGFHGSHTLEITTGRWARRPAAGSAGPLRIGSEPPETSRARSGVRVAAATTQPSPQTSQARWLRAR
jgi:hypothetical protein